MIGVHDFDILPQFVLCDDWLHGIYAFHVIWNEIEKKDLAVL